MSRTIEVQYILKDEEGTEVARFQNIEDAKQYDRMLTAADEIFDLFNNIKELDNVKENIKDEISFQIAKNSSTVMDILSNISNKKKTPKKTKSTDVDTESSAE